MSHDSSRVTPIAMATDSGNEESLTELHSDDRSVSQTDVVLDADVTRTQSLSNSDKYSAGTVDVEKAVQLELHPEVAEGGWRSWLVVFGAFLVQAATLGHITAFGVYEAYYKEIRLSQTSPSAISWIGSTQFGLMFGLSLVTGPLVDAGRFQLLLYGSTILYAICEFTLSLTKPEKFYQVFLAQGLGMGIAMALSYTPSVIVLGYYFRTQKRALAMGIATCGVAAGGIVQPIMLNNLVSHGVSFANTVRYNAAVNTALLLIASLIMRDPRNKADLTIKKAKVNIGAFFRDVRYVLLVVGGFGVSYALFFPAVYIQLFSFTKVLPQTFSFYSLSILNGASLMGRAIPGIIADRYTGPIPMIIAMACGVSVTIFGFLGIRDQSVGGVTAVAIVFGFFSGGFSSLLAPTFASTTKNEGEIGPVYLCAAFTVTGTILMLLERAIHYSWFRRTKKQGAIRSFSPTENSSEMSAKMAPEEEADVKIDIANRT
ncbi:MFS general substrate transporter [Sistotremastrum niveocremeum HHB9708]|uniref:MFS general substrate transporter n=1 Tax=Sistotremastrum niveocremeum HHB9708 TaxID=1314777 RepID=A0A164T5V7_9AGAM|nr:MFS general substrate transporter [Sistotremastrum niveocremeum HHB9708]